MGTSKPAIGGEEIRPAADVFAPSSFCGGRPPFPQRQPTISLPEKNCAISVSAVVAASEPCTEFSPIDLA